LKTATRPPLARHLAPASQVVRKRFKHHMAIAGMQYTDAQEQRRIALIRTCRDTERGCGREVLDEVVSLVIAVLENGEER